EAIADEAIADETTADETTADETTADEAIADEAIADEAIADETTADEAVADENAADTNLVVRTPSELSAGSVQSPDDLEATYRHKAGEDYQGYVTNLIETADPENHFQLIIDVRTDSNNVDDAQLLLDALPDLQARTDMETMYGDGAYNSPELDQGLEDVGIKPCVSAIRGAQPDPNRIGLAQFDISCDEDGTPTKMTCPEGQEIPVSQGRTDTTFIGRPDPNHCELCPLLSLCAAKPSKEGRTLAIYFN
ncbi:MAG: hypothetical protein AAF639_25930, partial [Chloroflexota bacterium]